IKNGGPVTITDVGMTRFLLSLNQAVDTVFQALNEAQPGDIIVPRAPAAKMTDVAKVLIGDRQIQTVVTGIRPGEKLHEIMISDEEVPYVYPCGDYYAIRSMLPELNKTGINKETPLKKEFS